MIVPCEAKRNPDEYRGVAHFSDINTDEQIHFNTEIQRNRVAQRNSLCYSLTHRLCVEMYLIGMLPILAV